MSDQRHESPTNLAQATDIWGLVMEKVVEGKEFAAEKVTLLKEASVEKVNSMKENVDDAITFESDSPVRKNYDAPVFDNPDNNVKFYGLLHDPDGDPDGDHDGDHDEYVAGVGGDLAWPWLFWQRRVGRVPGFQYQLNYRWLIWQ